MGNQCCFCEQPLIIPKEGDGTKVWRKHRDVVGFAKAGDGVVGDFGPFGAAHYDNGRIDLSIFDKVFCSTCAQAIWWELEFSRSIGGMQLQTLDEAFG